MMHSVFVELRLSLLILIHSAIFHNSACAVCMSSASLFEGIAISASSAYMLALTEQSIRNGRTELIETAQAELLNIAKWMRVNSSVSILQK